MAKEKIEQIWPEWQVEKQLGKGSFGAVYQAVRRDNNIESRAAIKVISIPANNSELDSLRAEGLSIDDAKTYFHGVVNDFADEIRLMESLKGTPNIVGVEDYKVVERTETVGWDIYIRMELLTPFNSYVCDKKLTEAEVIKLGIDICSALEICSHRNVIHRDIKPENIFVNDFGYFKLGDFGIARKLENATGGLSQKGTVNYMAPEVVSGTQYDARVDLYSLGIVLYRLLNQNRLPFIENEKQLLNPNERKNAAERRIRGEMMAPPCEASAQMSAVIMRACAFDPRSRFANATEMKRALQQASVGAYVIPQTVPMDDLDRTVSVQRAGRVTGAVPPAQPRPQTQQRPPMQPQMQQRPPVAPKSKEQNGWSLLCLLSWMFGILPLFATAWADMEGTVLGWFIALVIGFVPVIVAIISRRQAARKKAKGKGVALATLIFSQIWLGVLTIKICFTLEEEGFLEFLPSFILCLLILVSTLISSIVAYRWAAESGKKK